MSGSDLEALRLDFARDDGGTPLPVSGTSLRADGESHADAWRALLRRDPCAYCGGPGGTVDHVIPRAEGRPGTHDHLNLIGACQRCNGRKGARPLLLFLLMT